MSRKAMDKIISFTIPDKSASDPREYKLMTLSNGIECILISDPEVEQAAMALCVGVGHMADPDHLPGLAHFLEHMLFLGSTKYPIEGEYKQFLKDHGGKANASTTPHQTVFQFDVASVYLWDAVDRLAQFFISPLFNKDATDRELNAVNSEFSNKTQNDARRLYQFNKSLTLSSHPFHKFGTGNIQTLRENVAPNIDVRSELISFYNKYYSSSIMKVAIVGTYDIETLTQRVNTIFSPIRNLKIKKPEYSHNVYGKDEIPMLYKLVPIKEKRELRLNWIMDSCYQYTLEKPTRLLSYCLGNEGKGSILSYLKQLGLATSLSAGCTRDLAEFTVFSCKVFLTVDGLSKWEYVLSIIYQYIHKMRMLNDKEWNEYFIERSKVKEMNFNFKGKEKSYKYVRSLALSLHRNYPKKSFLQCHYGLLMKYDHDLIKKYLSFLTADNCYYILISKQFKEIADNKEKWYGTQYKKESMDKILNTLDNKTINDNIFTPPSNEYIAGDFSICCDSKHEDTKIDDDDVPHICINTEECKIWFKMDKTFKKPKLCVNIKLYSPIYNEYGALSMHLTDLVLMLLNDALSDETYAFEEAAMRYSVAYNDATAIVFSFNGYNEKLHLLVETVLKKLQNLKKYITKQKYEIQKELLERNIVSMKKSPPTTHCKYISSLFLIPKTVSIDDLETSLYDISLEKVLTHYDNIFNKGYIEALIYGNIDINKVKSTYYEIMDKYLIKSIKNKYILSDLYKDVGGAVKLENGNTFCVPFKCPNAEDKNSCISCQYMYKLDDKKGISSAVVTLFAHVIKAPCFRILRTEQQLGYTVKSSSVSNRGLFSFRIIIQSNHCDPRKLNDRIEAFLAEFRDNLQNMENKTFDTNKESVITNLLEKSRTIKEENKKYWREIALFRCQFKREVIVSEQIKLLTKDDILAFYDLYVSSLSNKRCKLSVECFGNKHNMQNEDESKSDDKDNDTVIYWNIGDVDKVRQKYGYHPFPYVSSI